MHSPSREELEEFRNHIAQLGTVMADLRSSLPNSAEAKDSRGAVRVTVGQDGIPERVSAVTGWQDRLPPAELGDAVVEAARNAASTIVEQWERNLPAGPWNDRPESGPLDSALPVHQEQGALAHTPPERDLRYVLPRSLDEMAEEAITALESAGNTAPEAGNEDRATGSDRGRHLTLTIAPGAVVSCEADAGWAARASTVRINSALNEALENARSALARLAPAQQADRQRLQMDGLLNEALAVLRDPNRLKNL